MIYLPFLNTEISIEYFSKTEKYVKKIPFPYSIHQSIINFIFHFANVLYSLCLIYLQELLIFFSERITKHRQYFVLTGDWLPSFLLIQTNVFNHSDRAARSKSHCHFGSNTKKSSSPEFFFYYHSMQHKYEIVNPTLLQSLVIVFVKFISILLSTSLYY